MSIHQNFGQLSRIGLKAAIKPDTESEIKVWLISKVRECLINYSLPSGQLISGLALRTKQIFSAGLKPGQYH